MRWYYGLICAVPAFLYVGLVIIQGEFFATNLPIPPELIPVDVKVFEAGARAYLLALTALFLITCVGCLLRVGFEIIVWNKPQSRWSILFSFLFLIVVGFALFQLALSGDRPSNVDYIGNEWFTLTFDKLGDTQWGLSHFNSLINLFSIFAILTIAALIVGGVACLDDGSSGEEKENWKLQAERFKFNIFMSSGMLVIGVLLHKAWTHYPIVLLHGENSKTIKTAFGEMVNSLTVYNGLMYSLLLAGYALPVAYILSWKADKIALDDISKGGTPGIASLPVAQKVVIVKQKRKKLNLIVTATEMLQTIAALIAPLLTGALTSMVGALG